MLYSFYANYANENFSFIFRGLRFCLKQWSTANRKQKSSDPRIIVSHFLCFSRKTLFDERIMKWKLKRIFPFFLSLLAASKIYCPCSENLKHSTNFKIIIKFNQNLYNCLFLTVKNPLCFQSEICANLWLNDAQSLGERVSERSSYLSVKRKFNFLIND